MNISKEIPLMRDLAQKAKEFFNSVYQILNEHMITNNIPNITGDTEIDNNAIRHGVNTRNSSRAHKHNLLNTAEHHHKSLHSHSHASSKDVGRQDDIYPQLDEALMETPKKRLKSEKEYVELPRKPLSAYMYYCLSRRAQLKLDFPHDNSQAHIKKIGIEWKALSEEDKQPWVDRAKAYREEYQERMEEINNNNNNNQKHRKLYPSRQNSSHHKKPSSSSHSHKKKSHHKMKFESASSTDSQERSEDMEEGSETGEIGKVWVSQKAHLAVDNVMEDIANTARSIVQHQLFTS